MSTDLSASFNEQYININTKLKKRFMRKPNISEATNEFIALAIQCEHSEQPAFAGQTYIGAGKCEASAGNFLGEAEQYVAAARQFMKAEKKLASLKFPSPDRENLEAAIGCYMHALNKYPEGSPMRASILLELASDLLVLNHRMDAVNFFVQALALIHEVHDEYMTLTNMRELINILIDCTKYEHALKLANTLCDTVSNIPEGVLSEIQVTRVLLALLLDPDDDTTPESLKQLISDLLDDTDNDTTPFNMDLRLKLQSIIISKNMADKPALVDVASDIKQYLNLQQKDLLVTIIAEQK